MERESLRIHLWCPNDLPRLWDRIEIKKKTFLIYRKILLQVLGKIDKKKNSAYPDQKSSLIRIYIAVPFGISCAHYSIEKLWGILVINYGDHIKIDGH